MHLDRDEIKKMTDKIEEEAFNIFCNAERIAWYMRGGICFTDIMNMTHEQIENLNKIIESNLETTKKSRLPFF
jgi:hypothetical protein